MNGMQATRYRRSIKFWLWSFCL